MKRKRVQNEEKKSIDHRVTEDTEFRMRQ